MCGKVVWLSNLLEDASRLFDSDSPRCLEGKVLAAYIDQEYSNGRTLEELRPEVDRLHELCDLARAEIADHSARLAMGAILSKYHPESWVLEMLEEYPTPNTPKYLNLIEKGEHYEIPN